MVAMINQTGTGTGMPVQISPAYAAGSNSPNSSAIATQNEMNLKQSNLIKNGGRNQRKRRKTYGGGVATNAANTNTNANTLTVPPVQAGAINASQTTTQYAGLTALAAGSQENAKYDKVGGRRSRRSRKSRKSRKSRRSRRSKKSRRTRRR